MVIAVTQRLTVDDPSKNDPAEEADGITRGPGGSQHTRLEGRLLETKADHGRGYEYLDRPVCG